VAAPYTWSSKPQRKTGRSGSARKRGQRGVEEGWTLRSGNSEIELRDPNELERDALGKGRKGKEKGRQVPLRNQRETNKLR